jgi:protein SCO1/2
MRFRRTWWALSFALAASAGISQTRYDPDETLAISQAAVGRPVASYEFLDREGQTFTLDSLRGKPVVISMVYTSCYHICPMLTQHLARVADIAWDALGDDSFAVVTIGFDTSADTPARMRQFAAAHDIDAPNWYFLSGDETSVAGLAADIGFIFFASPKGFDHTTQTTVLDGDGRVYRQVYGQSFKAPALVEPLKELVFETPADAGFVTDWLDNVRLFCTVYDPKSGRYRFDYSIFVGAFVGMICLGAVATFIIRSWKDAV